MRKTVLVVLLVLAIVPAVAGHPNHDHSAVGEPSHPSYDLTRVGVLGAALFLLAVVWSYTTYQRQDRVSSETDGSPDPGWRAWYDRHFESVFLIFLIGAVAGAVIDAHEHAHGVIETIFAPGHIIAAGAAGGAAVAFLVLIGIRYPRTRSVWQSIPTGYKQTAVALPLFFLGFLMDQGWHIVFGFEDSGIEVMSPTHLWVLIMGLLLVSGPLRRAWYTETGETWGDQVKMLISATLLVWVLSFLMRLLYPYLTVYPASWFNKSMETLGPTLGVAGMLVYAILIMVVILHLVRRFSIVPGGLTFIYSIAGIAMVAVEMRWYFIPAILATGFVMDLLYWRLRPSKERLLQLRLFAFAVPFVFALTYHATVWWLGGIIWVDHVWMGSIVFAGIGGLLASHAVQPVPMARMDGPDTDG